MQLPEPTKEQLVGVDLLQNMLESEMSDKLNKASHDYGIDFAADELTA